MESVQQAQIAWASKKEEAPPNDQPKD